MGTLPLLYRPTAYFRTFTRRSPSLAIALGVFLLIAVVEAHEAVLGPERGRLSDVLLGVSLNWLVNVFFFGVLWFYVGARLFGGQATLDITVRAIGYAFLWPGIISFATVVVLEYVGDASSTVAHASLLLRFALALWSICLAGIAMKYVHSLSWGRAIVVVIWLPALLLALAGGLVLLDIN